MEDNLLAAPSTFVSLGVCQLSQWALDFDGNLQRILKSIDQVKRLGGFYRLGPELEVCGYSCEDHFNESDTTAHCWQSLNSIVKSDASHNCLLDIGMPVEYRSVRYNCRIFVLNGEILLIRPKSFLANDGAYRESRWFGAWRNTSKLEEYVLPKSFKQRTCPFGFAAVQCRDCMVASETCEELFVPQSPHLQLCLHGVDIFSNGSASYFQTGKLRQRLNLIMGPTDKMGGIYMYCNTKGNDGGQLYFDGASFIACNGEITNLIRPFRVNDVEVIVEHIDVNKVRSIRASNPSYALQASDLSLDLPIVKADIWLSGAFFSSVRAFKSMPRHPLNVISLPDVPEELGRGAACWLWDVLRRSGAGGFFLPLSGGADSSAVAAMVALMCSIVFDAVNEQTEGVLDDIERVLRIERYQKEFPKSASEMCYLVLHTAFLGTKNSSKETRTRAHRVSQELHCYHLEVDMDTVVNSCTATVSQALGFMPKFANKATPSSGGSRYEDLALQNIQARSRMIISYMLAGLIPTLRSKDRLAKPPKKVTSTLPEPLDSTPSSTSSLPWLLCLSTGNIDETLRGYFTKYDCSSADVNPIGSMSKVNLKLFLDWAASELNVKSLKDVLEATPTAELRPEGEFQTDEADMGITYKELYLFGNLRKRERCGPVEMYETLMHIWRTKGTKNVTLEVNSPVKGERKQVLDTDLEETVVQHFLSQDLNARIIGEKVKFFFRMYCANRHKTTTLPPSYHAEPYDPNASRYDWRPFLYPSLSRQFRQIDELVQMVERAQQ